MQNLFGRIKKSKFYLPNFISPDAKDLINRLLQPLPLKRIRLSEIKDHPWFKVNVPKYLDCMLTQNIVRDVSNNSKSLKKKKTAEKQATHAS